MKRLLVSTLAVVALLGTGTAVFAQHHGGGGGHPHPLPPPIHRPDPGHGGHGGPDRWHGPEHGWNGGWDRNHYHGGWFWYGPSVILLWSGGVYVETSVIWDPASGMYYWVDAYGQIHWVN